jgi:hypothetical protein
MSKKITILIILFNMIAFSQNEDPAAEATIEEAVLEESPSEEMEDDENEMFNDISFSFDLEEGNTDHLALSGGWSFSLTGNMGPFKDTEFMTSINVNKATLSGEEYANDYSAHIQFDWMANGSFSPFLFGDKSADVSIGLKNRTNFGIGAKQRFGRIFSVSAAALYENETTGIWDDEIEEEIDSLMTFSRLSVRPKVKIKFNDGATVIDYRTYWKPKLSNFDDYLWENELTVSIETFYESFMIDFSFTHKFISRYKYGAVLRSEDSWIILDYEYDEDLDDYLPIYDEDSKFYKDTDTALSIGLSFSL